MTAENLASILRICAAGCIIAITLVVVGVAAAALIGIVTRTNDD
jgi:uncharacterized membrane protein YiaA